MIFMSRPYSGLLARPLRSEDDVSEPLFFCSEWRPESERENPPCGSSRTGLEDSRSDAPVRMPHARVTQSDADDSEEREEACRPTPQRR